MAIPRRTNPPRPPSRPAPDTRGAPAKPPEPAQRPVRGRPANARAEAYPGLGDEEHPPETAEETGAQKPVCSEEEEASLAGDIVASQLTQSQCEAVEKAFKHGCQWPSLREKLRRRNVHPTLISAFEAYWEIVESNEDEQDLEKK